MLLHAPFPGRLFRVLGRAGSDVICGFSLEHRGILTLQEPHAPCDVINSSWRLGEDCSLVWIDATAQMRTPGWDFSHRSLGRAGILLSLHGCCLSPSLFFLQEPIHFFMVLRVFPEPSTIYPQCQYWAEWVRIMTITFHNGKRRYQARGWHTVYTVPCFLGSQSINTQKHIYLLEIYGLS